jgi:hypothetical protein
MTGLVVGKLALLFQHDNRPAGITPGQLVCGRETNYPTADNGGIKRISVS